MIPDCNLVDHLLHLLEAVHMEPVKDTIVAVPRAAIARYHVPPPMPVIPSKWEQKRASAKPRLICSFCKKNGETRHQYSSHVLKDNNGIVVCEVLRRYTCPICHLPGGDYAHTKRFCPLNPDQSAKVGKPVPVILKGRPNSVGRRYSK